MSNSYTYTDKDINKNRLILEITAGVAPPPNVLKINRVVINGASEIHIVFDGALSGLQESQLDTIIASHDHFNLADHKQQKIDEINDNSATLREYTHIIYDNHNFEADQMSLIQILGINGLAMGNHLLDTVNNSLDMVFPQSIMNREGEEYTFNNYLDFNTFYISMFISLNSNEDLGIALVNQVLACSTHEEIDAIEDTRS